MRNNYCQGCSVFPQLLHLTRLNVLGFFFVQILNSNLCPERQNLRISLSGRNLHSQKDLD